MTAQLVSPSIGRDFRDFIGYLTRGYGGPFDFHDLHDPINLVVAFSSGLPAAFKRAAPLATFGSSFFQLKRVAAPIALHIKLRVWPFPAFVAFYVEHLAIPRAVRGIMSSSAHTTSAFIKGFVARLTVGDDRHNESFRGESPINTLARVLGRCGWLKLPELERGKSISSHFAPKRPYHLSVAPLPGHFLNYQFKYLTIGVGESQGLSRVAFS